jgi:NTE family protein
MMLLTVLLSAGPAAAAAAPEEAAAPSPASAPPPPEGAAAPPEDKGGGSGVQDLQPLSPRPHLALVLSGGGARGAAHIGVLKVLEEMHIKPDLVVGTSMGSIVGGLYAAGYSAAEVDRILKAVDWKQIFIDRVDRPDRSYRRKQDDATFLIPLRLRFKGWKPYLPSALLGGQRLELLLRSLEIMATGVTDFDQLPIPFRAVGANLVDGQAVIIKDGSLSKAMRASMSIAGMFPPVEIDGKRIVDGGAASNLPIGIAQALGAEQIIAVDITSPLGTTEQLGSVFQIYGQWTGYLTEANRREDLKRLRPQDVLIRPELGDISFIAFERVKEAAAIGEAATRAAADALKPLAADDAAWAAFLDTHKRRPKEETRIDDIRIVNQSWVDDDIIAAHVDLPKGVPYDQKAVSTQVMRLHGLDYSSTIEAKLDKEGERGVLTLNIPPKPYGHNSLQFGASFFDDFEGESGYALSFRHLRIAANRRGGEWENIGQIGDVGLFRTEFYQPFDDRLRWFASMGAEVRRANQSIWADGEVLAEYRVTRDGAHLDFGRVFGRWGEARVGAFTAYETGEVRVGIPEIPDYKEHDAGYRFAFNVDTLDAVVFPHQGTSVQVRWADARESWGGDLDRSYADLRASHAFSMGRVTLYPVAAGCINLDEPATLATSCRLGGFLQLSGLGQGELLGDKSVFGGLLGYFALKKFDLGALTQGMYAGLSLETGNVYVRDVGITWPSLLHGGSVFLGARTVLGPVYFGYGWAEGGRDRIYFLLGQRF